MKKGKLTKKEQSQYLTREPGIRDAFNGLECQHELPNHVHKDVKKAIAIARKFNEEVLRPVYLEIDLICMEDHDYVPKEIIRKAAEWGLYSLFIPKLFGGEGLNFYAQYPFVEEISSVCAGLGHLIFIHYIGVALIFATFNIKIINRIFSDVVKSEKEGTPRLLDMVVTEPEAGTDIQEPLLLDRATIGSTVERVEGGYIINGRKIFISNGHYSYWHIVCILADKKNKAESLLQMVVPNGAQGFNFGRKEHKMGHLASTASELIFTDCFVPDKDVTISREHIQNFKNTPKWIIHSLFDFVVAATRAGVGAIGTGIARGAYENALDYAGRKKIAGDLLINHQWAQIILTDMYRNVNVARATYMESNNANALSGLVKILLKKPVYHFTRLMPKLFFRIISPLYNLKITTWLIRKYYFDLYKEEERDVSSGWASLAKYTCSDIGLQNSSMAIDLMGVDGLRHDREAEKRYRDSKLQQIYESTNQVNQINMFACLIGRNIPGLEIFK